MFGFTLISVNDSGFIAVLSSVRCFLGKKEQELFGQQFLQHVLPSETFT